MIEKERLKKLLKEYKVVYSIDTKCYCTDILDLHNNMSKIDYDDYGNVKLFTRGNWWHWFNLKDLFETEEEAEFALKYQNITRTETLSLPTWGEIKNKENHKITFWVKDKYYNFFCNWSGYHRHHHLSIYENYMVDEEWCWVNLLEKSFDESNYLFACELCRKLFLGEEV